MRVLLVCYAGMSTGILMKKMREYALEKQIPLEMDAVPLTELVDNYEGADIILLGPQVRYALGECEKTVDNKIPVIVIDSRDYGLMNGKAVLDKVLKTLNKE